MYTPDEWVTLLRNKRTKHSRITVENLTNEVIMDYKAFSEGMKNFHVGNCGTKVKWTVVKIIQLRKEPELTVFWKDDYESTVLEILSKSICYTNIPEKEN